MRDYLALYAIAAAIKGGWLPAKSYLLCVSDVAEVRNGPLLCAMGTHTVTLLSIAAGRVVYLDPRYEDPASIDVRTLDRMTGGFYWRVVRP